MSKDHPEFVPLYVDPQYEEIVEPGWWVRFWMFVWRVKPEPFFSKIPYGRRSVESQLSARDVFPEAAWSQFDHGFVRRLLGVVKKEMNLPNDHFLPDDPFFLVLRPEFPECFPVSSFGLGVREEFGLDISRERFLEIIEEGDWTIGRFAQFLYEELHPCGTQEAAELGYNRDLPK